VPHPAERGDRRLEWRACLRGRENGEGTPLQSRSRAGAIEIYHAEGKA